MPKWLSELFKQFPLKKLTRHDTTNLLFDLIALVYTLEFTRHTNNEWIAAGTWLTVLVLCLVCIFWASKQ